MPAIAAAAGWMEQFHKPMREVYKEFTRSELFILSWRNTEMAFNMEENAHKPKDSDGNHQSDGPDVVNKARAALTKPKVDVSEDVLEFIGRQLGDEIVEKCENEKGELDLRRLTGPQALHFMSTMNIPMGRV